MVRGLEKRLFLLVAVTACIPYLAREAAAETEHADPALTDQQAGMRENLEDSVSEDARPHYPDWFPETIRLILPENLRDVHDLEVTGPGQKVEAGSGPTASGDSEPDAGANPSTGTAAEPGKSEQENPPKLLEITDNVMDFSRLPLTYIQEHVPFLTRRQIIFFGRLEPELVRYTSGVLEEESGFQVRRFRAGLAGRVIPWPNWNYKIEVDLTDGENTLSDAYISWHSNKWGTVRIGNQKVAQTLAGQTSSISIPFMERPLPVLAFTLQRRLGIGYDLHLDNMGGNVTIFSTDLNESIGSEGYAGRFYYNPSSGESHLLHIGGSLMEFSSDNDARLRARPESNRTDTRLVDTGEFPDVDTSSAIGLELAGAWGPVTLRSELYRAKWGGRKTTAPEFNGWYATASWFLTGESAHYREGKFIRPRILSNEGAWEVAVRFSTIDLNDQDVAGGTEDNLALGLNWYSKLHWRLMGNAIKVRADGPEGEEDPWILQFRVQYYF